MGTIQKMINEAKKFGLREVIYHVIFRIKRDEYSLTNMLNKRADFYDSVDGKQLETELRQFYLEGMHQPLDFRDPKTFTEKIQLLKMYDDIIKKTELSDKYKVREWVEKKLGGGYLVPLLGVWDDYDLIDFKKLPEKFCMKMNHGSAMNYIVKDKNQLNYADVKRQFKLWFQRRYDAYSLEMQYKNIPRRIIAEEYIEELNGELFDYKFHCFNGVPKFIQCIGNRDLKRHTGSQNNYDLNWNKLDWIFEDYPNFPYEVPKPQNLNKMIDIASMLSEKFKYVRVDLYDLGNKVLFGEMTFTPSSGIYPYKRTWTYEKDRELGDLI